MEVLAWLAFPLSATAVAMSRAAWRGRRAGSPRPDPHRRGGGFASVDEFRRFTAALVAPGPCTGRAQLRGRTRISRRVS
jgi:hypothetical protein